MGFAGVYIIFLITAIQHDVAILTSTTISVSSKNNKKITFFSSETFRFCSHKNTIILNGRVNSYCSDDSYQFVYWRSLIRVFAVRIQKTLDNFFSSGHLAKAMIRLWMCKRTSGSSCSPLWFRLHIAIEPYPFYITVTVFCFLLHYENTPIQIYRKFHLQKLKNFR